MSVYNTKRKFDEDDDNKAKRKLLPSMLEHYKIIGEYTGEQQNIPLTDIKDINIKLEKIPITIADIRGTPIKKREKGKVILDFNYPAISSKLSIMIAEITDYINFIKNLDTNNLSRIPQEDLNKLLKNMINIIEEAKGLQEYYSAGLDPFGKIEDGDILMKFGDFVDATETLKDDIEEKLKEYNQLVNRKKLLIKKGGCLCDVNDMVYNAREWKEPSQYI